MAARHPGATAPPDWPGTLVDTAWLAANLDRPDLRIVDIRGAVRPAPGEDGQQRSIYVASRDEYAAAHIPGAVFVDWTADITDPDDPIPAQLAPPARFAAAVGALGIGDETAIVIYDDRGAPFATRLWWALVHYGHERVAVLDGGWAKWRAEDRPIDAAIPDHAPATFTPRPGRLGRATGDEVLAHVARGDATIVDALRQEQYTGAASRGAAARGHIPGALNLPYLDLLTPDGTWKAAGDLRAAIDGAGLGEDGRPVVAYCGGGVAATAVLFALDRLGRRGSNYDGSWSEWGNDPRFPTREGDAP